MRTAHHLDVPSYCLEECVGVGGFAEVYAARHALLDRRVAIKVLRECHVHDASAVYRFLNEGRITASMRHPAIAEVFELGYLPDGRPYIVMELAGGDTLEGVVREQGRLSVARTMALLRNLASAIELVHERGIVHRDLKPSNVMVDFGENDDAEVRLLDFGIAKIVDPTPTEREDVEATLPSESGIDETLVGLTSGGGSRLGSPIAMAPEQIVGADVDRRTDVYGLGVLLYFALAGRYPFSSNTRDGMQREHLESMPPPPSTWAPGCQCLDDVVMRCLEKLPEHRFPTVREVVRVAGRSARGSSYPPSFEQTAALDTSGWLLQQLGAHHFRRGTHALPF